MKITIEVHEMKCAKCDATAPVLPHLLFSKGQTPARFRDVLTPLMKMHTDAIATDSSTGHVWGVLADDKPAGWMKGPNESDLCVECGALWLATGRVFLTPPGPEFLDESGSDESNAASSVASSASPSFFPNTVYGSAPTNTRRP